MDKSKIKEQLELIQRDAGIILEKLENNDMNLSDEKRLMNGVKKSRRALSDVMFVL
jgi:hypothetical protein